jgi:hypothetical protein
VTPRRNTQGRVAGSQQQQTPPTPARHNQQGEQTMSAWIVSKAHIDFLVSAGKHFGIRVDNDNGELVYAEKDPDQIGQILWNENYRSVNYRYEENNSAPEYHYDARFDGATDFGGLSGLGFLRKTLGCYNYQSCETDDYYKTVARSIVSTLYECAADSLFELSREANTAERAFPWGLDDLADIEKAKQNAKDGKDCYGAAIN